jgi:hypothetical protein
MKVGNLAEELEKSMRQKREREEREKETVQNDDNNENKNKGRIFKINHVINQKFFFY